MTVSVYTVTDDCVHRDRDSDSVHSVSATVTVWQSCQQRQCASESVHRDSVKVSVYTVTVQ